MGKLTVCEFCERLYSKHSIGIHRPKCASNPNSEINRRTSEEPNTSTFTAMDRKNKPRRTRSESQRRPRTKCLTHRRTDSGLGDEEYGRLCFVCGRDVGDKNIDSHQTQCLSKWRKLVKKLPERYCTREPKPLNIPSVDGTVDTHRANAHALQESRRANQVRCLRCGDIFALSSASEHSCTRFQPTVDYYY